ncbi:MAG TPA: HNH endonuclease signature motif containing protein, partial [Nocardioidaceae bacterium]|nr:HNH endonuclease signature motif containing protein [Nocardioidaceae bacterium]
GEARRLACTAGLIPMVLGSDSVPLDLGREARLHSKHQRIALAHRYHGCAAHGCDRPPGWTEVHHKHPWSQGGRTDLDNGIPLCPTHHRMADRPEAWQMDTRPDGAVTFHRRE